MTKGELDTLGNNSLYRQRGSLHVGAGVLSQHGMWPRCSTGHADSGWDSSDGESGPGPTSVWFWEPRFISFHPVLIHCYVKNWANKQTHRITHSLTALWPDGQPGETHAEVVG